MEKQMTYREIEKSMSASRSLVIDRIKRYPDNAEMVKLKKEFDRTYTILRQLLRENVSYFSSPDVKRKKVMERFIELDGWEQGTYELSISELNKETEIKTEEPPSIPETKKVSEIKKNEPLKKQEMKKETEIKEGQMKMDLRGGARPGAGRKSIGKRKAVKIALSLEAWEEIDNLIQSGHFPSYAEYFRWLFDNRPKNDM